MCTSPCQTKWKRWKESIQIILVSVRTMSVYYSYFCNLQSYINSFHGKDTLSLYVIVFLLLLPLCLSCKLCHVFRFTKNVYMRFVFKEYHCMFYYGSSCMHDISDFPGDALLDLLATTCFIMVRDVCMACWTVQEMQFWTCSPLYWLLEFIILRWVASTHHLKSSHLTWRAPSMMKSSTTVIVGAPKIVCTSRPSHWHCCIPNHLPVGHPTVPLMFSYVSSSTWWFACWWRLLGCFLSDEGC